VRLYVTNWAETLYCYCSRLRSRLRYGVCTSWQGADSIVFLRASRNSCGLGTMAMSWSDGHYSWHQRWGGVLHLHRVQHPGKTIALKFYAPKRYLKDSVQVPLLLLEASFVAMLLESIRILQTFAWAHEDSDACARLPSCRPSSSNHRGHFGPVITC
jgi:hypothetical protein